MVLILVLGLVTTVLPLAVGAGEREPVGTAFTYQGLLEDASAPANGSYDLRFRLYDSATGDTQVGSTVISEDVAVTDGTFTVRIEFGDVWDGTALWLDIGVRPGSDTGTFTALSPLQPFSAAPAALTLRPGARVEAALDDTAVLTVTNSGSGTDPTRAVYGHATTMHGVVGQTDGDGTGVFGISTHPDSAGYGVYGVSYSQNGEAVYGWATAGTGQTTGTYGRVDSTEGRGVVGSATADSGETKGVHGVSHSTNGTGVYGTATATNGEATGVEGLSESTDGQGVRGVANATSGYAHGVVGYTKSTNGTGVWAEAEATSGTTNGLFAISRSPEGIGVYGKIEGPTSGTNYAVYGDTASTGGRGVYGITTAETGYTRGVLGRCDSTQGRGVYGWASATSGTNYGVYGNTSSPDGYAGYFSDRVHVNANFSAAGAKAFKIDHPLAPASQYLYHFAQETPEVQNVYNGVVQLDGGGVATVALPAYFTALNTGVFRYQLTAIGAAMPNLHVAKQIELNTFLIAGGEPGHEVSWEVTAVRNDPYVRDHRLPTEKAKPAAERGTYLYPEGYGQPETLSRDHEPHDEAH